MVNVVYLLLKLHVLCALTVSSVGKENKTEKAAKKGGRKVKKSGNSASKSSTAKNKGM